MNVRNNENETGFASAVLERMETEHDASAQLHDLKPFAQPSLEFYEDAAADFPEEILESPRAGVANMPASEALKRLKTGETLKNVRIERLRLTGEFTVPIRMERVHLVQPSFDRATFLADVEMIHGTIERPRFNGKTTFAKAWNLKSSTLLSAIIRDVTVAGPLKCDYLRTRGKFLVANSTLSGQARFWDASFEGWVEFKDVTFADQADFRSLSADEGFVLTECRFARDCLFRGASISKKWEATRTRFDGLLDFSKAKLNDFVYLETIEQGPGQQFAFHNTVAERLSVRPDQLNNRLASERAGNFTQAMAEFGLLKRVFEGLHRYEEEDWAFYKFKINQRRCRSHTWRKPWTELSRFADWLLLDRGCAYGTSPMRAVASALVLILAFALLYAVFINSLHVERVPFGSIEDKTSLANRVMIGLTTSVASFISGYGDLRDVARGGFMNLALIAESLLGTLLWGLFIVAFSRKVIR
jgi:hypothetical protein